MGASGPLRERDLRFLTAVVGDGLRDDPGEAMPWAVLDRLHQLIPCDAVQFDEMDVQGRRPLIEQVFEDGGERIIELQRHIEGQDTSQFWALRDGFLPYTYGRRTGDHSSVLRWSDFYSAGELKNQPFYRYISQYHEDKYAIFVPLPTGSGRSRRVAFWRSNSDFGERDRLALQLLRPHLHEVYLDADRRRHASVRLSRREREVLQLAAQGYSNAEISALLFISTSTVRKHMEHIFDRTGVRTRGAAAALALPSPVGFQGGPRLLKDSQEPAD
jgi:DNA-binding CsgD family transcriptional regulator